MTQPVAAFTHSPNLNSAESQASFRYRGLYTKDSLGDNGPGPLVETQRSQGMAQQGYIPVAGSGETQPSIKISPDGIQHLGNGAMWVSSSQESHSEPVYVSSAPSVPHQPPAGFMYHHSTMSTSQQRPPPPPQLLPSRPNTATLDTNTPYMVAPSQTLFMPPHPVITGPAVFGPQRASLNIPTGNVMQAIPIQHSPYGMALHSSSFGGPVSAAVLEPNGLPAKSETIVLDDPLSQQRSSNFVYSSSEHSETPLSAAFPQNLANGYASVGQQPDPSLSMQQPWTQGPPPVNGPPLQQTGAYQIQVQASDQTSVIQYQGYWPPMIPASQVFEAQHSTPVIYHYQPGSQPQDPGPAPPLPRTDLVYQPAVYGPGSGTGPFVAPQSAPPLSQHRPNDLSVQVLDHRLDDAGRGRTQQGQSGRYVQQYSCIPAGFSASHSQIPTTTTSGVMASDDGEDEELAGTLAYDPYMVCHPKSLQDCG